MLSFELGQTLLFQFPATIGFGCCYERREPLLHDFLLALLACETSRYGLAMILIGLIIGPADTQLGLLLSSSILGPLRCSPLKDEQHFEISERAAVWRNEFSGRRRS